MGRVRIGEGILICQIGHLGLFMDLPRPFLRGFRGGLYDKGIMGRFLEIPSLEILRIWLQNGVARLRATFEKVFFKSEKTQNFFKKNNFNFIKLKFFLKKKFWVFSLLKKTFSKVALSRATPFWSQILRISRLGISRIWPVWSFFLIFLKIKFLKIYF